MGSKVHRVKKHFLHVCSTIYSISSEAVLVAVAPDWRFLLLLLFWPFVFVVVSKCRRRKVTTKATRPGRGNREPSSRRPEDRTPRTRGREDQRTRVNPIKGPRAPDKLGTNEKGI